MTASVHILCSFAVTFGAPIAIAAWDLLRLDPTPRPDPPRDEAPPEPTPLPDAGTRPDLQKPLPDCLIPKPTPARVPEMA